LTNNELFRWTEMFIQGPHTTSIEKVNLRRVLNLAKTKHSPPPSADLTVTPETVHEFIGSPRRTAMLARLGAAVVRRSQADTLIEKERAEFDYETALGEIDRAINRSKHGRKG